MGFNWQAITMDLLASSWPWLYTVLLYSENDQRKEYAGLLATQMIQRYAD